MEKEADDMEWRRFRRRRREIEGEMRRCPLFLQVKDFTNLGEIIKKVTMEKVDEGV